MGRGRSLNTEKSLQAEIKACDTLENHYKEKLARIKSLNWHWLEEETVSSINHYQGRRKYLIRKLSELQIKDFDNG